jgi:hypothetical protein
MKDSIKIGEYIYRKSTRQDKKLMTVVNNKEIHFGQKGYEHYLDKTELLDPKQNHKNTNRRKRYLARAKGIKDKTGRLTWKDPESPNYHSIKILW